MPIVRLPTPEEGNQENMYDTMIQYKKQLEWLLLNLDSMNVKEITTEYTRVHSELGETIIDGPLLKMNDKETDRLVMGYDKVSNSFGFILRDEDGSPTISLDSKGQAIFKGIIKVLSDDTGYTVIDGPLITMNDGVTNRLSMGYHEGQDQFMFTMRDKLGQTSMELNDSGEAVFRGSIDTFRDIYVGDTIYLTNNGPNLNKRIVFDDSDSLTGASIEYYFSQGSQKEKLSMLSYGDIDILSPFGDMEIQANDLLIDAFDIDIRGANVLIPSNTRVWEYENSPNFDNRVAMKGELDYLEDLIYQVMNSHINNYHSGGEGD